MRTIVLLLLICGVPVIAHGEDAFAPGANITTDGIPPVPLALVEQIERYSNARSAAFAQWHPTKLEMLIRTRFADTVQVHRVSQPMGMREQLTFYTEPVLGVGEYVNEESFTIQMDTGGNEMFQLYRFDPATGARVLLTDGKSRHSLGPRSKKNGLLAYERIDSDKDGALTEIWTIDPLKPETKRKIATLRGGGWGATDWSPDGTKLLLNEYISVTNSRIWLMDVESGKAERILPADEKKEVSLSGGQFEPQGRLFYYISDEGSEFKQLRKYLFYDKSSELLTKSEKWDVEEFDLAPDGNTIAYTINVAGASEMEVRSIEKGDVSHRIGNQSPAIISGLKWHNDSTHLAYTTTQAYNPGQVFVVDIGSTEHPQMWAYGESGMARAEFRDPELVTWKGRDGVELSGFLYTPPAKFTGPRPSVVIIHGGPEGQSRPVFQGRWNYFVNELGVALIYPNVRGSTGYGKTFANLDNGVKREGTYDDIGALLDWIVQQPNLDPKRIMIYGGSYGGHMTLATATRFSDKIACSVNLFGISNLVSFLENTSGYRRDLRRAEYGDERDPAVRAWMEKTAPMAHVDQIRKPMMVQQGVNDPRVPKSESDQIVAALKKTGTPVWYLVFADEGHGFLKKPNTDFAFYTTALFAQEYLLK